MKITLLKDGWSIFSVKNIEDRINPQPAYQRTEVWTVKKKQLLIDSILRGYDLPKFYLRVSKPPYEYEVVDGQQRLNAIWGFCNDVYSLSKESDFRNLSGKKWSDLSGNEQKRIGDFELSVVLIEDASDLEIGQLFLRLQEGVSLNPAEKRNAMPGDMRDFIVDLSKHGVFPLTRFSDVRFKWHDIAAIITCLEINSGPTDVKSENLKSMYEGKQNFDLQGRDAKKIKRNLNYMKRVLKDRPPAMNIKWGFVDLYLLISKMYDTYAIRDHADDFAKFYSKFEKNRHGISDPRDLISADGSLWDRDLYDYIQAFSTQGGTRENIQKRHDVYKKHFLNKVKNLQPKDSQRTFNYDQRIVIWQNANGKCNKCKKEITIDEMHADHIKPHSKGGKTTLDNAQALCQQCNAKKAAT